MKNKNNIDFSRLPLQFRSLVLANYGLSRFSFPLQDDQLLQNPKFSTAINNIFNRVRIANYLDGFEKNEVGLRIMNSPIYRPLDQEAVNSGKTLMIKMNKFKNGVLQIEGEDNTPAINTFLAIEGTINPTSTRSDDIEIQITDREEKEFSTTNIIKQNAKRQELTSFDRSSTTESQPTTPSADPTTSLRPNRTSRASSATRRSVRTTRAGSGGSSGGGGY